MNISSLSKWKKERSRIRRSLNISILDSWFEPINWLAGICNTWIEHCGSWNVESWSHTSRLRISFFTNALIVHLLFSADHQEFLLKAIGDRVSQKGVPLSITWLFGNNKLGFAHLNSLDSGEWKGNVNSSSVVDNSNHAVGVINFREIWYFPE